VCIDYKYTRKKRKEWLKDKPDTIIAYKVVKTFKEEQVVGSQISMPGKLYPLFYPKEFFKRKNRIKTISLQLFDRIMDSRWHDNNKHCHYVAYYHFYVNEVNARRALLNDRKLIICKIPKRLITNIGLQNSREVIIAKGFEIVGQDKYLEEK